MSVELTQLLDGRVVLVTATGKLLYTDYEQFVPELNQLIQKHGKIRILFDMHDFKGWSMGAMWEDIKFDIRHFRDIERLALIGESFWEKAMAVFCKPFTSAKIRYFSRNDEEQAMEWIREGLNVSEEV